MRAGAPRPGSAVRARQDAPGQTRCQETPATVVGAHCVDGDARDAVGVDRDEPLRAALPEGPGAAVGVVVRGVRPVMDATSLASSSAWSRSQTRWSDPTPAAVLLLSRRNERELFDDGEDGHRRSATLRAA
jgi:hypothetical protein